MITKLHIENFKCLRDVTVELKPLTVLIGKNDTGKTSLLEALGMLGDVANGMATPLWQENNIDNVLWRGAKERRVGWEATIAPSPRFPLPGQASYKLALGAVPANVRVEVEQLSVEGSDISVTRSSDGRTATLREDGRDSTGNAQDAAGKARDAALAHIGNDADFPVARTVADALATAPIYRFEPQRLTSYGVFNPSPANPGGFPRLGSNGDGLPAVLDFVLGTRRKTFDQIERELCDAVPQVKGIQVMPAPSKSHSGAKAISFELAGGHSIPASFASDGVLFLLAYLTLIHAPGAPAVIRLEEPENGIHPRQLERVAGYLKRLTDPGRGANAAQILVATHSPYFLDFVPPESVIVFGRRENGETVTAPILSLPGVQERIDSGFSLGEMWFNVGEDELLKDLLK
jgi:predicted ATPase